MTGKIHVFPAWEGNPYLNMLYIGARSEGWTVGGTKGMDALVKALPGLGHGDIFHIHWTSPVLSVGVSRPEAEASLKKFKHILRDLHDEGVYIIWTVHNTLTHNTPHTDLEVRLAELLAHYADRIIQLNERTREVVAEFYDLPEEKLVTIKHASYAGIYSEPPSQGEARERLGIPSSAQVVGFVGQIRGYKGIPTLLRAVGSAASELDDLHLVLAGKTAPDEIPLIERDLPDGVPVVRRHTFISDADIATWFAACDVMVFPYERVLNSGSVLLSATFARPCILPAEPHLVAEHEDHAWVSFYEPGDNAASALSSAILDALPSSVDARDEASRFASAYSTMHMAWDYVSLIEEMTSTPVRDLETS